eukprot:Nitzschia sp. Nitz4//scaffold130_size63480//35641//37182//NITZ4_006252-RA/size63480-snap-gene-0.104-mRNA-1//-1//CDS//3329535198//293//frame0
MDKIKRASLTFALLLGCFNLLSFSHLDDFFFHTPVESSTTKTPSNEDNITLQSVNVSLNIPTTSPSTDDNFTNKNIPYQMWLQYKHWHSQQALEQEFQQLGGPSPERKFSIVYYSCPHQAGNRLRNFAESMIWSMLTNRTALWKYYSNEECKRVNKDFPKVYCHSSYNVETCQELLDRNPSLPSFEEWQDKFKLPKRPRILRHWVTHTLPHDKSKIPNGYSYKGASTDNGIVDTLNETVVVFPFAFLYSISQLNNQINRETILSTQAARDRAVAMLTEPDSYIYGLVRHHTFHIQPKYEVPPQYPTVTKGHIKKENDGSHIHHEQACLDPILSNLTKHDFCQLVLLSDREGTLLSIQAYIQQSYPSCFVHFVPRPAPEPEEEEESIDGIEQRTSWWTEHGSFAGTGFFQDMSLVANQLRYVPTTRTAFVAAVRSSNRLVADTIHYELYRRHDHVLGQSPNKLERCLLEGSRDG